MTERAPASHVFHRALHALPVVARGEGAWLFDESGRRYIDGSGGAAVVNVGHGRAAVAEAMARQAQAVAYVHGTRFTSAVLEEYAHRLARHAPGGCDRLYLLSGGSEATETAIKLARAYHLARGEAGRFKVLGRQPSYHGNTLGALSLSGRPTLRAPYEPLLAGSGHVTTPRCCEVPLHLPGCAALQADAVEAAFLRERPESVAALFVEPMVGASAGVSVPPEGFLALVRALCDRYGVLLVADEVMAGFGRTGRWFGIDWSQIAPDLVTCGKGMSAGYMPVGAVLARGAIVDAVEQAGGFVHGFTFSHHAVTAAACLAVLEILEDEKLVERVASLEPVARAALRPLEAHPHLGPVRGRGLLLGFDILADRATGQTFPREEKLAARVATEAFFRGLVTYPVTGTREDGTGDAILLAPPFVVSEEQLREIGSILDASLGALGL